MQIITIKEARQIISTTKGQLFRQAWGIARVAHKRYEGKISELFVGALVELYAKIRTAKVVIAKALRISIRTAWSRRGSKDFGRAITLAKECGGEFEPDSKTWLVPDGAAEYVDFERACWQLV